MQNGPLDGMRVLEFAGLGPAPFACMLLSDLGAEVIRIARPGSKIEMFDHVLARGRYPVELDLKNPDAVETCLSLIEQADILIEGFRPGVMERLGLGPDICLSRNEKLVYGRMTGWGQTGKRASTAGHDINYISATGILGAIGDHDKPSPPLNLVGDFGGGALYLAFGVLAAILHARAGGRGQVVDCAMIDGATSLMSMTHGMRTVGLWHDERNKNLLDGGAPFYGTYCCSDGLWVAIGAIEPTFFRLLLEGLNIDQSLYGDQMDRKLWPNQHDLIAKAFAARPRAQWCTVFEGSDACFSPVLTLEETMQDPENIARGLFVDVDGEMQPAPAPRFSATPAIIPHPAKAGHDTDVLARWGVPESLLNKLNP